MPYHCLKHKCYIEREKALKWCLKWKCRSLRCRRKRWRVTGHSYLNNSLRKRIEEEEPAWKIKVAI